MEIVLNGQREMIEPASTVAALVEQRLAGAPCAIEVNRTLVPKAQHDQVQLNDGDHVEIVTLVGGG